MIIYHKATVSGVFELLENYEVGCRLCCSTDKSSRLFWRNAVLIMDIDDDGIKHYTESDTDSKGMTEYDEARVMFESTEDFKKSIKYIVMDGKDIRKIKTGTYKINGVLNSPIVNKFFNGKNYAKAENDALNFKLFEEEHAVPVLNLTQAKKINKKWTREFLYI